MNNPNISRLVLLKTSLENDYKNTIWFGKPEASDTKTKQTNYFLSKKYNNFDFTNLTYIRKDRSVKIPAHYDSVVGANYVMYQNSADTKWYYAFIVDIKYISEGVTELVLETEASLGLNMVHQKTLICFLMFVVFQIRSIFLNLKIRRVLIVLSVIML